MKIKKSGIYKISNNINNKLYIGSSKDLNIRKNNHFNMLRRNSHHSKYLQNAVNKHGIYNFKFEIIEYCDVQMLPEREEFYLKSLLSADKCLEGDCNEFSEKSYNIKPSCIEGFKGLHSYETLVKIQRSKGLSSIYKVSASGEILGEFNLLRDTGDKAETVRRSIKKRQTLRDKDYGYIYSKDYYPKYKPQEITVWNKGKKYIQGVNITSYPVYVYDIYGRFIETAESLSHCARKYKLTLPCAHVKLNTFAGKEYCFFTEKKEFYNLKSFDEEVGDNNIEVYTIFNEFIGYSTRHKISETLECHLYSIDSILQGKRKQCKRYVFKNLPT